MPQGDASRISRIAARFKGDASATRLERIREAGHLRLRPLRGACREAVLVNTAGGIVCGDRLTIDIAVHGLGAGITIGTAAAEKCYRSDGPEAVTVTSLTVADGARLDWLPQETILFDGTRMRRSLAIDLAATGAFLGTETLVFGRLALGETMAAGALHDSWRVRRGGRLIFADETRIVAPVDASLDGPAAAGGARAASLLLAVGGGADDRLDMLREAIARFSNGDAPVESGASLRDGVLVARMLSRSPERLRACLVSALGVMRPHLPRSWF